MASGWFSRNASSSRSRSFFLGSRFSGFFSSSQRVPLSTSLSILLGGLAVQLPAEVAQLLVEQLDDVEVVEDVDRVPGRCSRTAWM